MCILVITGWNLLPSCITCNQPGEGGIGKRNRFPLQTPNYALTENGVGAEQPLLINPLDSNDADPENHLGIDLDSGLMTYSSKRGETCVNIFGLNKRDQLLAARRAAINEVKVKFVELMFVGDEAIAQTLQHELKAMQQGSSNYTLARRTQLKRHRERSAI